MAFSSVANKRVVVSNGVLTMNSPVTSLESIRFECLSDILCVNCQAPLDRHQPDTNRPDQLLGTCLECGVWYLIDAEASAMFPLPDVANLRHY